MVYPDPTNPGYFDPTAPAFNSTIGVNKVDVVVSSAANGRVVSESFTKGSSGQRDPVGTDQIFPSYSRSANYPTRVSRNGIRQLPSSYANKTWSVTGPAKDWGVPYMSLDGTNIVIGCLTDSTIWCSSDSGLTWYITPAFDPITIGRPFHVVGNRDATVIVVAFSRGDGQSASGAGGTLYVCSGYVGQEWGERSWDELVVSSNWQSVPWHSIAFAKDANMVYGAHVGGAPASISIGCFVRDSLTGSWSFPWGAWRLLVPDETQKLASKIAVSADGTSLLVVGTQKALFYSTNQGISWTMKVSSSLPVTAVGMSDDGTRVVWNQYNAGTDQSKLVFTRNALAGFTSVTSPVTYSGRTLSVAFVGNGSEFYFSHSGASGVRKTINFSSWSTSYAASDSITLDGYYPGHVVCPYDGLSFFAVEGRLSTTTRFPVFYAGDLSDGYAPYIYSYGGLLYQKSCIKFTDVPALEPGEIVTLEYLTESTTLLPTLYPYN